MKQKQQGDMDKISRHKQQADGLKIYQQKKEEWEQNGGRYLIYPQKVIQTDKKLLQVQKSICNIVQQINLKQDHVSYEKNKVACENKAIDLSNLNNAHANHTATLECWDREDEIDHKNKQYIQKIRVFYQGKLAQQRNRYLQLLKQHQTKLKNQTNQLKKSKQQIEQHINQKQKLKLRVEKAEEQNEWFKNQRTTKKQRITQMLLKQKQQIFNKYNTIQKQTMTLLQFTNKVQEVIQRKSTTASTAAEDQSSNKMSCIKQIQLQASNYYSSLSNPILQQILSSFTQGFNLLNKKIEKLEKDDKKAYTRNRNKTAFTDLQKQGIDANTDNNNMKSIDLMNSRNSLIKLKRCASKQQQPMKSSALFQNKYLKEKLQKLEKIIQQVTKQHQQEVNILKKKIDRYATKQEVYEKEKEKAQQKYQDTVKRMKFLQEQVLDYERKNNIEQEQNREFKNKKSYYSAQNIQIHNNQRQAGYLSPGVNQNNLNVLEQMQSINKKTSLNSSVNSNNTGRQINNRSDLINRDILQMGLVEEDSDNTSNQINKKVEELSKELEKEREQLRKYKQQAQQKQSEANYRLKQMQSQHINILEQKERHIDRLKQDKQQMDRNALQRERIISQYSEKINGMIKQHNSHNLQLSNMMDKYSQESDRLVQQIKCLQQRLSLKQGEIQSRNARISQLQGMCKQLEEPKDNHEKLQAQLQLSLDKQKQLSSRLQQFQHKLEHKTSQLDIMCLQNNQKESKLGQIQAINNTLLSEKRQLLEKSQQLNRQVMRLNGQIVEREESLRLLNNEMGRIEGVRSKQLGKMKEQEHAISELQQRVEQYMHEIYTLSQLSSSMSDQNNRLKMLVGSIDKNQIGNLGTIQNKSNVADNCNEMNAGQVDGKQKDIGTQIQQGQQEFYQLDNINELQQQKWKEFNMHKHTHPQPEPTSHKDTQAHTDTYRCAQEQVQTDTDAETLRLNKTIQTKQLMIKELSQLVQSIDRQLCQTKTKLNTMLCEQVPVLQSKIREQQGTIDGFVTQLSNKQCLNSGLVKQVQDMHSKCADRQARIANLESMLSDKQRTIGQKQQIIRDMSVQQPKMEQHVGLDSNLVNDNTKQVLDNTVRQLQNMNREMQVIRQQKSRLDALLKQKTDQIQNMKLTIEAYSSKSRAVQQVSTVQKQLEQLNMDIRTRDDHIRCMQQQLKHLNEILISKDQEHRAQANRNADILKKLQQKQDQLIMLKQTNRNYETMLQNSKQEVGKLEKINKILQMQNNEASNHQYIQQINILTADIQQRKHKYQLLQHINLQLKTNSQNKLVSGNQFNVRDDTNKPKSLEQVQAQANQNQKIDQLQKQQQKQKGKQVVKERELQQNELVDDSSLNQINLVNQINETQQNLVSSKQLSIMYSQIKNFKEQLNGLLFTIQQKDKQIAQLKVQLSNQYISDSSHLNCRAEAAEQLNSGEGRSMMKDKNIILSKLGESEKDSPQNDQVFYQLQSGQLNDLKNSKVNNKTSKNINMQTQIINNLKLDQSITIKDTNDIKQRKEQSESEVEKLQKIIIEQEQQLKMLNINQIRHEYLTAKVSQLEETLQKQKQMYQNQINKSNIKVFELEKQIRNLREEIQSRKNRMSSDQYFSLNPLKKGDHKQWTSQDATNNYKTVNGRNRTQQNQSFHSLSQGSNEENKIKTEKQINSGQKSQDKDRLCKIRRQKSHQYQRSKINTVKIQKLSSIQRRYDSDQKSKEQKQTKIVQIPKSNEQSPINANSLQFKFLSNLKIPKEVIKNQSQLNNQLVYNQQVHHSLQENSNQTIKNLTEQNKQLKYLNSQLNKDLTKISEYMSMLSRNWEYHKNIESHSQGGRMIGIQKLQQDIKLLQQNKLKILQQFNAHDLEIIFDNVNQLIQQTKRWVDVIQNMTNENKRMAFQKIFNKNYEPKFNKTKTLKFGNSQQTHRRSRSVYSEGNVYRQHHIDIDQSRFQMQQQNPQPQLHHHIQHQIQIQNEAQNNIQNQGQTNPPINSLQILFRQNNELSQISSVKHRSINSGFFNSRSEIAKMFENREKQQRDQKQKEQKKQEHKKGDIVDDYTSNQKCQKHKQKEKDKQKYRDKQKQKQKLEKQKQKYEKQRQRQKFDKTKNNISIIQNISTSTNRMSRVNQANLWQNSPLIYKNQRNGYHYKNQIDNLQAKRINRFQGKSNKSKSDFLLMLYSKLQATRKQLQNCKIQSEKIINNIKQKHEEKMNVMKRQFNIVMKKMIQNKSISNNQILQQGIRKQKQNETESFRKYNSNGGFVPGRISQKDEQIHQKMQQLQIKIQRNKLQIQSKQKLIQQLRDQIKECDKKIKEQKMNHQLVKNKYNSQLANSAYLQLRIGKLQADFRNFTNKLIKKNSFGAPSSSITVEAQTQANIIKVQNQQIAFPEKGKTFLKGKKVAKAEAMPQTEQVKNNQNNNHTQRQLTSFVSIGSINSNDVIPTKNEKQAQSQKGIKKQTIIETKNEQKPLSKPVEQDNSENQTKIKKYYSHQLQNQKKNGDNSEQKRSQSSIGGQQVPLVIQRVKTQQSQSNVANKDRKSRGSDKSQDSVKSMSITQMLTNIINPNNTIIRKKTISQASKPQQIIYYQKKLSQINQQLKSLLLAQSFNSKKQKIESKKIQTQQGEQKISLPKQNQKQKQFDKQKQAKQQKQPQKQRQKREKQKQKQKDAEKIKPEQEIIENISILGHQITNLKQQMMKSVTQREERLKDILKSIIIVFKISKRSIEKVIDGKQKKDNIEAKYINSRLFFKNLYNQLKQKNKLQRNTTISVVSNNTEFQPQQNQFQSFEQKYSELNKQNEKLRQQLQEKTKQCQNLSNQLLNCQPQNRSKLFSRNHSFASNQNDENFQDFENKQLFDNTKPSFQLVEELKLELQHYKKKCQEYQIIFNKKKNDKLKYIRKW